MKEIREVFTDNCGDELILKRETTGDIFIGLNENGYYSNFAATRKDIKAIRKVLKKMLKEATIS